MFDELSVGFLAGAFAKFFTTPIANIVTRKQTASMMSEGSTARRSSVGSIASQIHSEKGLQGFWSGYSASLVLTLNPSLTFLFYETLKRALLPRSQRPDPPPQATFLLAAVSKALASSITYPFSLAKTRAQVSSKTVDDNDAEVKKSVEKVTDGQTSGTRRGRRAARGTVFSTILHIARTEGLSALYEGLSGEVLKGFFSHGITMIVKESVHKMIIQLYYAILKLMKRYPNPSQVADMAKSQVQQSTQAMKDGVQGLANEGSNKMTQTYEATRAQAQRMVDMTKAQTQQPVEAVKGGIESAQGSVQDLADKGFNKMTQAYHATGSQAQQSAESLRSGLNTAQNKTQEMTQRGSEQASKAYENTKDATLPIGHSIKASADSTLTRVAEGGKVTYESGKDVTGGLATNATDTATKVADYVGEKTENMGRAIRPAKGGDETE